MSPQSGDDYKKLLTELIKKQIIILGPTIAITNARGVKSLTITDEGVVTQITGDPKDAVKQLIEQFVQLSGLIVRKTLEPFLSTFPSLVQDVNKQAQIQEQNLTGNNTIPSIPDTKATADPNEARNEY